MERGTHKFRIDNGQLCHDGDCHVWSEKVCTCGLLHYLLPLVHEADQLYPNFAIEYGIHSNRLNHLLHNPIPDPVPMSEEESKAARELLEKVFGPMRTEEKKDEVQNNQ